MDITKELRALRVRSGLSQAKMAKEMGLKGQSSWQHYEDPNKFRGEILSPKFVAKLAQILTGKAKKGERPIAKDEVWRLAGKLVSVETVVVEGEETEDSQVKKMPVLKWGQIMPWMNSELTIEDVKEYVLPEHESPGEKPFEATMTCDCMSGDLIFTGDKVVCDPRKPYGPGKIVIAQVDGEDEPVIGYYHKRRRPTGERFVEIVPSNQAWPSHIIDEEHPGKIVGPIVQIKKFI